MGSSVTCEPAAGTAQAQAWGADAPTAGLTTRDSAGLQIVEHHAAFAAALPVWTIDTMPELRLRPPAEPEFTAIGDLLAWPHGRVFVADRRLRDVRESAADGAFTRVAA